MAHTFLYFLKSTFYEKFGRDTPLHLASASGDTVRIQQLLAQPQYLAKINSRNASYVTPLFLASTPAVAELLLKHGADPNILGEPSFVSPSRPLHYHRDPGIISVLVKYGANVDALDTLGSTALHRAAERLQASKCKALLEAGAKVNAVDSYGETPLNLAVGNSEIDDVVNTARVLISHGADVNAKNKQGLFPLWQALCQYTKGTRSQPFDPNHNTLQILLDNGARMAPLPGGNHLLERTALDDFEPSVNAFLKS